MLTKLHIKNIAVIDEVDVEFQDGFNVLTGETGAGKSIIIDSINMVLGERTSRELIRNGEQKAVVEALFEIDSEDVINAICELGIEVEDGVVLIYRDLNTDGKGTCRINGQMVTAGMIKELAKLMINIHGQQDNQSLLNPSKHTDFLDSYACIMPLRQDYKNVYDVTKQITEQIENCNTNEQEKERKIDLLQFQIDEIFSASLKIGEEEQLTERRAFLGSASKISEILESSANTLYDGNGEDSSVHDLLSRVVRDFSEVAGFDEKLQGFYSSLESISIELDDVIYQIRDYADNIEFTSNELDLAESRLDTIYKLKRKYGASIAEILAYLDSIQNELDAITQSDERIKKLQKELEQNLEKQERLAQEIHLQRVESAKSLEQKVMIELADLDMNKVQFKVNIERTSFNQNGFDSIEFLISTNIGDGLKPLSKIASGGEMSRIMLAIKSILADTDNVSTLIFDEIDTGVSGRAAQKIAEKIDKISRKKQILCITHLAQIASMAGTHFLIEKSVSQEKTKTSVAMLSSLERENELARIIGGAQITDLTLQNAKEMLQLANKVRGV